ncbi:MAG: TonB-dependent receptor [Pseudomonadota bacterium]
MNKLHLLLAASGFAVAAGTGAHAQTNEPVTGDEEVLVQNTITVTAQFREQDVLDVPIAITAYDGEFLEGIGVDEFDELSAFTPGFVVQEQSVNNPGFVLRGITSDDGASNIEPRVSIFQNGVSFSRSRGSIVQLFDVERIEVLKGPQGTLFGRSAQIGAVHVITNKPGYEFSAGVTAEAGNFESVGAEGFINIPLIEDKLAVRFAGSYDLRDGFVDNLEGGDALQGTNTLALRGSLRFEPTSNLTLDLIASYSEDSPPGTSFASGVIPASSGEIDVNEFASLNTFGNFLDNAPLGIDREIWDITAISNWKISDVLSNTTTIAYREFDSLEVFDPDGTAFDIFIFAEDASGETFSADTRFNYDAGGRFRGFFGGGVFLEEGAQSVPLGIDIGTTAGLFGAGFPQPTAVVNGQAPVGNPFLASAFLSGDPAVLNGALGLAGIPAGIFQEETFTNFADNFSFDLFAEAEFDILPKLTLTLGGRYTRDDKETLFESAITQPNPATPLIFGVPFALVSNTDGQISSDDFDIDNTFDGFSWRAVLKYQVTDNLNAYFNYSRGRRPEVIEDSFQNQPTGEALPNFDIIPEETVDSFEFGAKGSFLDNRLILDGAVYYYDYQNFQTGIVLDGGPGQPPIFETVNAGAADAIGVEVGMSAQLHEQLSLFATYGFNEARFDDTDGDGNAQDFGGNQFRLSPDHSFSIGLNAEQPLPFGTAYLTPTFTWKSEVFFTDENDPAFDIVDPTSGAVLVSVPGVSQDSFGLLNFRGGVRLGEQEKVNLFFYVENALDEEFVIDGGNTGGSFGIPTFIAGKPRFYGGGISVQF